tara:strand:+ start:62 stop:268 length:207 start_codon:yes stop_codon:yes gene_type:complete
MKNYKVENIQVNKKYACVLVSANSEREAIDKAKSMDWKDFDEKESGESSVWETKEKWSFTGFISKLFT